MKKTIDYNITLSKSELKEIIESNRLYAIMIKHTTTYTYYQFYYIEDNTLFPIINKPLKSKVLGMKRSLACFFELLDIYNINHNEVKQNYNILN